ncbi:MAG: CvpA family protein [Legionellaceae bacterium]|nr:CvpA family protein [Legionellaceae bacterium]
MIAWYWVDGVIIGILALSVVTGLVRGFVKELIAICIWVMAIWLAYHYYQVVAGWLTPYVHDHTAQTVAGFVLIMLGTVIVGSLVNALLSFILRSTGLTGTDRLLGMGFGFVRGVFIVALLILSVRMTSLIPTGEYTRQSYLYAKFDPVVNWLYGFTPDLIKQMKVLDQGTEGKLVAVNAV